jgi:hypothetical protein
MSWRVLTKGRRRALGIEKYLESQPFNPQVTLRNAKEKDLQIIEQRGGNKLRNMFTYEKDRGMNIFLRTPIILDNFFIFSLGRGGRMLRFVFVSEERRGTNRPPGDEIVPEEQ